MVIYRIEPDVNRYCSLIAADAETIASRLLAFDGASKRNKWPEILTATVDHARAPEPDILDLGAGNLVLHGRSWKLLEPELRGHCELLPVTWKNGVGDVVNVIGLSNCLDADQTQWVLGEESGKRIDIEEFVFVEDRVPSSLIFKITDDCFQLFCTDRFKSFVEYHQLTGLTFAKVWASAPNS